MTSIHPLSTNTLQILELCGVMRHVQTMGSDGNTIPILWAITTELISNCEIALVPICFRTTGSSFPSDQILISPPRATLLPP